MDSQKHLFNLDPSIYYLNCAYKAPLLKSVEQAATAALIRDRNPAYITIDDFFNDHDEVKTLFASLVNANKNQVITIPSTTYGFSSVLNNTPAKNKGNVVTFDGAFPSGYFSLTRWAQMHGNQLNIVFKPDPNLDMDWNESILNAINEATSVVIMAHVHWMNGYTFDLEKIGAKCKTVGATFIVDGTQSVGALPMDIKRFQIDALICASYKWMFGPYALGVAYLSSKYDDGQPLEESWTNRTNARNFSTLAEYEKSYVPGAGRYNVGEASNMILLPMLKASIIQLLDWQPSQVQLYVQKLAIPLKEYLRTTNIVIEKGTSNHLIALKLPQTIDQKKLVESLKSEKVYVSDRGSSLRVSLNVFNESRDITKLISILDQNLA